MPSSKLKIRSSLLAAALIAPLSAANAQTASASGDTGSAQTGDIGGLQEIVVTAQRRSENVQKMPASISAIGGDELAARQITALREVVMSTPNIQQQSGYGGNQPVFAVRGVTSIPYSPVEPTPVATYYDEVYKGTVPLLGIGLYDLDRVEVLKGPQGTLYGRSTTGGAINLISRKPEFTNQANASVSYGSFNRLTVEGGAESALSDVLAVRVAGIRDHDDGVIENVYPGEPDAQQTDLWGVRASLRYQPSKDADIVLRYSHSDQNFYFDGTIAQPTDPSDPATGSIAQLVATERAGLGRREINTPDNFKNEQDSDAVALNGTFQLTDNLSLTSVTSWDHGALFFPQEYDGVPEKLNLAFLDASQTQISQDTRITTEFDGPFNVILGGFYSHERASNGLSFGLFQDVDVNGDGVVDSNDCIESSFQLTCTTASFFRQKKTSAAVYTDGSYKLTDALTLRGGVRYTYDEGRLYDYSVFVNGVSSLSNPTGDPILNAITGGDATDQTTLSARYHHGKVSYKFGIDYTTLGGALLYASYNVGYRAATFNNAAFATTAEGLTAAKPEKLAATEIGLKSELFDRRVRLNAAAFYYTFSDQQVQNSISGTNVVQLLNLPRSRIIGVEMELTAKVTSRLRASFSAGHLDTKVETGTLFGVDIRGNELVQAPEFTLSAAADYALPLGGWGTADFHADFFHTASQYYDIANSANNAVDEYNVANARIRVHPDDNRFGVALWVKNLTDEYFTTQSSTGIGYTLKYVSPPRTYGIAVDAKF